MRISDWSSDVCSSDLRRPIVVEQSLAGPRIHPVEFGVDASCVIAATNQLTLEQTLLDLASGEQHEIKTANIVGKADLTIAGTMPRPDQTRVRQTQFFQEKRGALRRDDGVKTRDVVATDRKSTRLNSSH